MPLRNPPPEVPIIKWLSPNRADQGLIEFWNTEVATYTPLDIGAAHPNTRDYPGFKLGKQAPVQGDENWTIRIWVTDETSPEWFNWALKYSAEDSAYPIFIRTYREPKNTYTPRTKGEPLRAFYKLVLDDAGSGFTPGTSPEVIFGTESDTPAIAHGVVAPDGTLAECVLDFCGDEYEGDVTFRVDAPANGNPASGTAYIQPDSAILVREEANQYPEDSELYALYLQVTRVYETLPGPSLVSTKIAEDGMVITISTTRGLCADIVSDEVIVSGNWVKTTKNQTDIDFVCEQVIESRPIPGNPMVSSKLDQAGNVIDVVRTLKDVTTITPSETVNGSDVWIKTYDDAVSDLVAWEVVEAMQLPGIAVPSGVVNQAHDVSIVFELLEKNTDITPAASESGGIINTVEAEPVSGLVSNKKLTATPWLDEASYSISIPNLIPEWARPQIPTLVESHIIAGTASDPTLGVNEFSASERQLTRLLYERRVEKIPDDVTLPVTATNQETTEEFGGGLLNVTVTLDDSALTADTGLLVVESRTSTLAVYTGGPPDGLFMKITKELDAGSWPTLPGTSFDREMQVFTDEEEQVVAKSYSVDVPSVGDFFVETLKPIDDWRGKRTKITKTPTAVSLETALVEEIDGPFQFPGIAFLAPSGLGYYRRQASAQLCQQILRTWWLSSATKPTRGLPGSGADVEVQDIIMDDIIISTLNDITVLAYSGMCLHDAITTFGTFVYAATTPSATDYIAMIGTEIVVGATIELTDIPNLWKIQTKSVIAR